MTDALSTEAFYQAAIAAHQSRLVAATKTYADDPLNARIAVADLLQWSVSFSVDVLGLTKLTKTVALHTTPVGIEPSHILLGAYWARNAVAHGRADLLTVSLGEIDDGGWSSPEMLWDDPEGLYDETGETVTVRFAAADDHPGDKSPWGKPFYDACIQGRRVIVVAGLLGGGATLSGFSLRNGAEQRA